MLSADLPLAEYARGVMRFHFDEMLRNEAGTRLGEDIEALHDMRVATRRLRAIFEVFAPAFRPRAVRRLLRDLRNARQALGPVRDLDVFIQNAEQFQQSAPVDLQILITTWQKQREIARAKMLRYLDSANFERFKTDFEEFLAASGKGARHFDPKDPQPQITWQAAPLFIYQRYAVVLACEPILLDASPEQLHDLRIYFKKFRYAVEFFRDVLGKPAQAVIADLKTIQDHLGNLNDVHLACSLLSDLLQTFEAQNQHLPIGERPDLGGILTYLSSMHAERHRLADTFPQTWAYFVRSGFRQNLALALSEM